MILEIEVLDRPARPTMGQPGLRSLPGFIDETTRKVETWFSKVQNYFSAGPLSQGAPEPEPEDAAKDLEEIDRRLMHSVTQANLWSERAALCREKKLRPAAFISDLTASILQGDSRGFLKKIGEFVQGDADVRALLSERLSETEKGQLLVAIRRKSLDAEFHYAFNLAYATKFTDTAIFSQAVDSMRTGYTGEKRPFFGLAEISRQVGLLKAEDLAKIKRNVQDFVRRIGSIAELTAVLTRQFHILLSVHLGAKTAGQLLKAEGLYMSNESFAYGRFDDLTDWPQYPGGKPDRPSTRRWHGLVGMERLKEISLADMFTGDLYRPAFTYPLSSGDGADELQNVAWISDLPPGTIPPDSDGKPIARAIFHRFSQGSLGRDWDAYFRNASGKRIGIPAKARSQRVLLWLVSEFGPLRDFEEFIVPWEFLESEFAKEYTPSGISPHARMNMGAEPDSLIQKILGGGPPSGQFGFNRGITPVEKTITKRDIYFLTLCCDSFRLHQAYQKDFDNQKVFVNLLKHFPRPPHEWVHFRDSAEQIIFCLFLNDSQGRKSMLETMFDRTLHWLSHAIKTRDEEILDEALTVMSYLEVGVLMDQLPKTMGKHHLHERRRVLWMEHARTLAIGKENAWKKWITTSP